MRVRYLMALLVGTMVVQFEPASMTAGIAVVLLLLGVNAAGHVRVSHLDDLPSARRFAATVVTADGVAAVGCYLVFLTDVDAMPVALLAFFTFELTLRWGRAVAVAGFAAFSVALVTRVYLQVEILDRGSPRVELVLLWVVVASLLVALGRELQGQEQRWQRATEARDRVATDLRATVGRTLSVAGIAEGTVTHQEVLAAVRTILEDDEAARDQLIDRIATVLAVPHHGLSPREQEILLLVARGHTDARIAAALFISPSTVRNHLHNMRAKLDLATRGELKAFASHYALPI